MNQRRDSSAAFESYLRNVASMDQSPTLIIRETSKISKREELLQHYIDFSVIHNPCSNGINSCHNETSLLVVLSSLVDDWHGAFKLCEIIKGMKYEM